MKTPSAREITLTKLRVAGYHDDQATFTRAYVEGRVSYQVAKEAFRVGRAQRAAGVRCDCHECREAKP